MVPRSTISESFNAVITGQSLQSKMATMVLHLWNPTQNTECNVTHHGHDTHITSEAQRSGTPRKGRRPSRYRYPCDGYGA